MKKLTNMYLLAGALLLLGCGEEARTTSASESVAKLAGAFAGSSASSASMALSAHVEKMEAMKESAQFTVTQNVQRHGEMLVELASSEAGILLDYCSILGATLESSAQSGIDDQCALSSCSNIDSGLSYTLTCSSMDQTVTCGSDSYQLSNFTYSTDVSLLISGETASYSLAMTLAGDVSGAATGTLDCTMGFEVDAADAASIDCEDSNFACSLAGTAISCEDLNSSAGSASCQ